MEFWNETLTAASWEKLKALSKEIDFVVIGGWAAYLWTGQHKSKDIDIIVDYETLSQLQQRYRLDKNNRLHKYEIKLDKFDIDIYLAHFSRLALPVEEIILDCPRVQGIKTVPAEVLLVLKQGAEIDRRHSVKGTKDAIDILTLLRYAPLAWPRYTAILSKHSLGHFQKELVHVIETFDPTNIRYLGMEFVEFKRWKKELLTRLRQL